MSVDSGLGLAAYLGALGQQAFLTSIILVGAAVGLNWWLTPRPSPYPQDLPRIREPPGCYQFSLRTRLAAYNDCLNLFQEAYEKYSKRGKSVLVPGPGWRDEVALPPGAMTWLMTKQADVLSAHGARVDYEHVRHSLGHDCYVEDNWQGSLMRRELIPALDRLSGALWDELCLSFDNCLGADSGRWRAVDLHQVVRGVIAQVSSRFIVGLPLCRNKAYVEATLDTIDGYLTNAKFLAICPDGLRPIAGRLGQLLMERRLVKLKAELAPVFDERLRSLQATKSWDEAEPRDLLSTMMQFALEERPHELTLDALSRRIVISNLDAIYQTSAAATNLILNIIASDPEHDTLAVLRDEFATLAITTQPGANFWSRANIARLVKTDSVSRETMRLHSMTNRAMSRKVVGDGIKTEDGIALPRGSTVSILSQPVHTDEETFKNPHIFEPFRFARAKVDGVQPRGGGASLVTTGQQFLPFGHGKAACPGRFMVDLELKMIVGYLLANYDMRFPAASRGKRPDNQWAGETTLPPADAKVEFRRRRDIR